MSADPPTEDDASSLDRPSPADASTPIDEPSPIDAPSPTDRDRSRLAARVPSLARDPVAVPGLLACVAGLLLTGTAVGLLAAPVVVGLWALASPVAVATGAVLLLGVLVAGGPTTAAEGDLVHSGVDALGGPSGLTVGLVGVGVGWLLVAPAHRDGRFGHVVGATLVAGVAAGAVAIAALQRSGTAVAAIALLLAVAFGCYALHRYSLVRLAYRDPP